LPVLPLTSGGGGNNRVGRRTGGQGCRRETAAGRPALRRRRHLQSRRVAHPGQPVRPVRVHLQPDEKWRAAAGPRSGRIRI